jgi:uncharacterized protein YutE (UPF0331/DUF86 family)
MAILDRLLNMIHVVPINDRSYQTSYYEDNLSKLGKKGVEPETGFSELSRINYLRARRCGI